MRKQCLIGALVMGCVMVSGVCGAAADESIRKTVSVSASEQIMAEPDKANISFTVESIQEEPSAAAEKLAQKTETVLKALTENGLSDDMLQTTSYQLNPEYDYDTKGDYVMIGYKCSETYKISKLNVEEVGSYIDVLAKNEVENISRIEYETSKYDELYNTALQMAIQRASEKAQILAESAGYQTIETSTISEGFEDTSARYTSTNYNSVLYSEASYDTVAKTSVIAGEISIEATVSVVYELIE